jgi:L-idonate 5-dehydrogenase
LGKRVLITGCGPIGVLCVITARLAGAAEIIATDLADNAIALAKQCGADRGINVATQPDALSQYEKNKGYFDVMFECSGSEQALAGGIAVLKPRSVLMQLGLGGDMTLPLMQLTAKEIDLRGSFRFHTEFAVAVGLMSSALVDVKPLISHTFDLVNAEKAFQIANDRTIAMKTQINFTI